VPGIAGVIWKANAMNYLDHMFYSTKARPGDGKRFIDKKRPAVSGKAFNIWSGRRDSNSRPPAPKTVVPEMRRVLQMITIQRQGAWTPILRFCIDLNNLKYLK
jgi:hypothetical protein